MTEIDSAWAHFCAPDEGTWVLFHPLTPAFNTRGSPGTSPTVVVGDTVTIMPMSDVESRLGHIRVLFTYSKAAPTGKGHFLTTT